MKKFICVLILMFLIGCGAAIDDKTSMVLEKHVSGSENYKYYYYIKGVIGFVHYYTDEEFNVGDRVKFMKIK